MKLITSLSIALIFIILSASRCKKDPINPVDQLPPETQTGANTFGCLVNGQAFKPGGLQLSGGSLNCIYQLIYNDPINGRVFGISAGKRYSNGDVRNIGFGLDSIGIIEGVTYNLESRAKGNGYGQHAYYSLPSSSDIYQTNNIVKGSVTFKRFDLVNQVASGTFWFNAVNSNGDTARITDGRFDVRYTQ